MLEFIIKLHPEIAIKSKSVRKRQTLLVEQNLRTLLKHLPHKVKVTSYFDHLTVTSQYETTAWRQELITRLKCIPGIVTFAQMQTRQFTDLADLFQQVAAVYQSQIINKSFCVRVKRQGEHEFSSLDAERYIGGGLNQLVSSARVQLKQPDLEIKLEIKQQQFLLVTESFTGMGGLPIPSQSDALSLISGGFDSAVASYLMIRKGLRTHYLFFNLGGAAHENGVREIAFYLWKTYAASHRVKFVSVDFAPVVADILEHVPTGLMGVVLKRLMMQVASAMAEKLGISAVVTGESIGQVASQTLANLAVIDQASPSLVLRPLIYHDKQDIVDLARQIGVAELAGSMPEYCGVISQNPTVNAILSEVITAEARLDPRRINQAIEQAKILDIRTVEYQAEQQAGVIATEAILPASAIVLDIRSHDEVDARPLQLQQHQVLTIPFYRLATAFAQLDQQQQYYCYCERGVMSRLQALLLQEMGFNNVAVYRP